MASGHDRSLVAVPAAIIFSFALSIQPAASIKQAASRVVSPKIGTTRKVLAAATSCLAPATSLVSWWPGDGTTVDIQDSNSGSMINGATFATGKVSQAFSFDGVNDRVEFPDASNLDFTTAFSFDAWVSVPDFSGNKRIVEKHHCQFSPSRERGWGITYVAAAGGYKVDAFIIGPTAPEAGCGLSSGVAGEVVTSEVVITDNPLHNIAMTYDGSLRQIKLYVDGVEKTVSVLLTPPTSAATNNQPLRLGAAKSLSGSFAAFHDGLIDEVEVFNRTLTADEIRSIYEADSLGKCKDGLVSASCVDRSSGIISWWPFDESGGTRTADVVDDNSGTLTNGPIFTTGEVKNAVSFDGADDYISVPHNANLNLSRSWYVSMWVNPGAYPVSGQRGTLLMKWVDGGENKAVELASDGTVFPTLVGPGDVAAQPVSRTALPRNTWSHVAATYNATELCVYVNGVKENCRAFTQDVLDSTGTLFFGRHPTRGSGFVPFRGMLDEVVWGTAAPTDAEIQAIYEAGADGMCNAQLQADTTPPSVTITDPTGGRPTNQTSLTINGTATDNRGVSTVTCNGVRATLSSPGATRTDYSVTVSLDTEGNNTITCTVTDTTGNTSGSSFTVVRDTTPPRVSSVTITPSIAGREATIEISKDVSDENGVASVKAEIRGPAPRTDIVATIDLTLISGTAQVGGWKGVYIPGPPTPDNPDGRYTINNKLLDAAGNLLEVEDGSFTIDRTAPTLSIVSVTPAIQRPGERVEVTAATLDETSGVASVTVQDTTIRTEIVSMDLIGGSRDPGESGTWRGVVTAATPESDHTLEVNVTDNAEPANKSTTEGRYTLDATTPSVTGPESTRIFAYRLTDLAGTYTDTNGVVSCNFFLDGEDRGPARLSNPGGTSGSITVSERISVVGSHTAEFRCLDSAGNIGTHRWTLDVDADTRPPSVGAISPTRFTVSEATVYTAEVRDEEAGVTTCRFLADGVDQGDATVSSPGELSVTVARTHTFNTFGSHSVEFRCRDWSGNESTTEPTVVRAIDTVSPEVRITSPADGATISGTITVTAEASDNDRVSRVDISITDSAGTVSIETDREAPYSRTIDTATLAEGVATISVTATDDSGNSRTESITVTLVKDSDGDGVVDRDDNCREVANPDQADLDADGLGNACDPDDDNDGIADDSDNCPLAVNPDQVDRDSDGLGDACDADNDNDGVVDASDNCPSVSNPDQRDSNGNGIGDACEVAAEPICPIAPEPAEPAFPGRSSCTILCVASKTCKGTEGNDVICGTEGNDKIEARGGDDVIWGLGGNDKINGGDGNDDIHGGDGNDSLYGEGGNDSVWGGLDHDKIDGNDGNDRLFGGNGKDSIHGGAGDDLIYVGNGDNTDRGWSSGGDGNDTLIGGSGRDRLNGDGEGDVVPGGNDIICGGDGDDHLAGNGGNDQLYGEGGNDKISGNFGNDLIAGGGGKDKMHCDDGNDVCFGGDGDDEINGGKGRDILRGGDGADRIDGGEDDDILIGGADNDKLYGKDGNDCLEGEDGNDLAKGLAGNDLVIGGLGIDHLTGEDGADIISGFDGIADKELSGGGGVDIAYADPNDKVRNAETVRGEPGPAFCPIPPSP